MSREEAKALLIRFWDRALHQLYHAHGMCEPGRCEECVEESREEIRAMYTDIGGEG